MRKFISIICLAVFGFAFKNSAKIFTVAGVVIVNETKAQLNYVGGAINVNDTVWNVYMVDDFSKRPVEVKYYNNTSNNLINFRTNIECHDSLNSRRDDGVPTSIIWADNNGVFKRSPISSLPSVGSNVNAGAGLISSGSSPNQTLSAIDQSSTNELQNLSINSNTLSISSGNSVVLPSTDLSNYYTKVQSDARYLQSYTETDPIWSASPSYTITNINTQNWNTAFGWGNHAAAGYATANNSMNFTNKTGNISQWTNDVGYQTQAFNAIAGVGVTITGSYPNKTFAVDTNATSSGTNAIMYVGKANNSINNLNTAINAKVPNGRQITINGITQDLSANRTWSVTTATVGESGNLYYTDARSRNAVSLTTTGTSGAATYNSSTGVFNIPNYATSTLPSQTGNNGKILTTDGSNPSWMSLPNSTNFTVYSSGTVYSLTNSSAKITFGTTSPSLTLTTAGTYIIFSNIKIEYAGLTTLITQTCNFKLRRTNNTAADITNASTNFNIPIVTLLSQTAGDCDIAPIIYTTANTNDIIEMWGNRGANVSAGNINVGEASIIAVKLY